MNTKVETRNGRKTASKSKPIFSKKNWPVQVAVFEFHNEGKVNHSIELSRTFRRDVDSEWENTTYLTAQDLLPAARLLGEAYDAIQTRLIEVVADRRSGTSESEEANF